MLGQFRNSSKRGVASFRDSAPDEELVAATKSGDELAFETLVKRHQRRIFALAFRYTRVREDAEDIVQETFQKAFVHLQKFEGKSSFSTWATRIAINQALMLLRRRRALHEVPVDDWSSDQGTYDLVAIQKRGIQFLRQGDYPPLRGTWVRFDDQDYLLYTQGYVPYLRTYSGMRSPQPQEIVEHHGTSPMDMVLREILALTKLNWNSADFSVSEPITLAFSRRVGEILAEMPATVKPQEEYRFYM